MAIIDGGEGIGTVELCGFGMQYTYLVVLSEVSNIMNAGITNQ